MSVSYDILLGIANKCKVITSYKVLAVDQKSLITSIQGEVNARETAQTKKKPTTAVNIKPKNAQEEILIGACKLVLGDIPSFLIADSTNHSIEEALVRKAQLAELRR